MEASARYRGMADWRVGYRRSMQYVHLMYASSSTNAEATAFGTGFLSLKFELRLLWISKCFEASQRCLRSATHSPNDADWADFRLHLQRGTFDVV